MIDVVKDLRERFDFSAYMILSAWEYEPDGIIDERTIGDFTDPERAYLPSSKSSVTPLMRSRSSD